jgi:hypothetical protein
MEGLAPLVGLFALYAGYLLFGVGARAIHAAGRAALGKGSLSDNLEVAFKGMSPMEARLQDGRLGDEPDAPILKEIQVKGLFPTHEKRRLGFVTSVFDNTSGKLEPVSCPLDMFQEPHTRAYQHSMNLGSIDPGMGSIKWVRVGVIPTQLLETPYGGKRKLRVILRLIDLDNKPDITYGFHHDHDGLIWQSGLDFDHLAEGKGYLELEALRDEARVLCVQIAMFIAMLDRQLSDREGEVLKNWIKKVLASYSGERKENLQSSLNKAMRDSYTAAKRGDLSLAGLTYRLKAIENKASKYEAIELCYDVLATNDVTDSDAPRIIDLTARALELDLSELARIRDLRLVAPQSTLDAQTSVEDLLGIDRSWDAERKKKHLRDEFQKWNNRLSTLPRGR